MDIRIYRTWEWVLAIPDSEVRMGGRNPMKLKATDTLQYFTCSGQWVPVPIVEAEKPEHPQEKRDREHVEEMGRAIRKSMDRAVKIPRDEILPKDHSHNQEDKS